MTEEELNTEIANLKKGIGSLSGMDKIEAQGKLTALENRLTAMGALSGVVAAFNVSDLPDLADMDTKIQAAEQSIEARKKLVGLINGALDKLGSLVGL